MGGSIPLTGSNVFEELHDRTLPPKTPILQFNYTFVLAKTANLGRAYFFVFALAC